MASSTKSECDVIPKKRKAETTDILSLLAQSCKETKSMIKAMMAKGSTVPSVPTPRIGRSTPWSWENQHGRGKDFSEKKEFFTWLHTEPDVTNRSVMKNGVKWYWCTKCIRFTSHKSTECSRKTIRQITASANVAKATKSAESDDENLSNSDESRISTEDFEEDHATKKMRRSNKRPIGSIYYSKINILNILLICATICTVVLVVNPH